jgi:HSP20 family protein
MTMKSLIPVGRDRLVAHRETNPFATLQQEIDSLFDGFTLNLPGFSTYDLLPSMDLSETDKEIEITVELPGLEEKDVEVNVADDVLTIRGEKKSHREEKEKDYRLVERSSGSFMRTVELPAGVDANAIKAEMSKGVLKVSVTKPAPAEAKKIDIKTAA